jgi:hypothetical protein
MGWTFLSSAKEKKDIIQDCIRPHANYKCIRQSNSGNELWTIWLDTLTNTKSIVLFILAKQDGSWGYKDIPESMGPFYFKCPLSFLKECTVQNEVWRVRVRQYHEQQNTYRRVKAAERRDEVRSASEKSPAEM